METSNYIKEEIIRDFLDFLSTQISSPPDYNENVFLKALEITNNSANDYYRNPTSEEVEDLIRRYLKQST